MKQQKAIYKNLTENGFTIKGKDGEDAGKVEDFYDKGSGDDIEIEVEGNHGEYEAGVDKDGLKGDGVKPKPDDKDKEDDDKQLLSDLEKLRKCMKDNLVDVSLIGTQTTFISQDEDKEEVTVTLGDKLCLTEVTKFETTYNGNKFIVTADTTGKITNVELFEESGFKYGKGYTLDEITILINEDGKFKGYNNGIPMPAENFDGITDVYILGNEIYALEDITGIPYGHGYEYIGDVINSGNSILIKTDGTMQFDYDEDFEVLTDEDYAKICGNYLFTITSENSEGEKITETTNIVLGEDKYILYTLENSVTMVDVFYKNYISEENPYNIEYLIYGKENDGSYTLGMAISEDGRLYNATLDSETGEVEFVTDETTQIQKTEETGKVEFYELNLQFDESNNILMRILVDDCNKVYYSESIGYSNGNITGKEEIELHKNISMTNNDTPITITKEGTTEPITIGTDAIKISTEDGKNAYIQDKTLYVDSDGFVGVVGDDKKCLFFELTDTISF